MQGEDFAISRLEKVRKRLDIMSDHYATAIHQIANVRKFVFGDGINNQVGASEARIAMNLVQNMLLKATVLQVCKMWDFADEKRNRDSLPSIVALLQHKTVLDRIRTQQIERLTASEDCDLPDWARSQTPEEVADQRQQELHDTFQAVLSFCETDERVARLREFRHRYLAHSQETLPARPENPTFEDVAGVLEDTENVLEVLSRCVSFGGRHFNRDRELADTYASALWDACRFDISS